MKSLLNLWELLVVRLIGFACTTLQTWVQTRIEEHCRILESLNVNMSIKFLETRSWTIGTYMKWLNGMKLWYDIQWFCVYKLLLKFEKEGFIFQGHEEWRTKSCIAFLEHDHI